MCGNVFVCICSMINRPSICCSIGCNQIHVLTFAAGLDLAHNVHLVNRDFRAWSCPTASPLWKMAVVHRFPSCLHDAEFVQTADHDHRRYYYRHHNAKSLYHFWALLGPGSPMVIFHPRAQMSSVTFVMQLDIKTRQGKRVWSGCVSKLNLPATQPLHVDARFFLAHGRAFGHLVAIEPTVTHGLPPLKRWVLKRADHEICTFDRGSEFQFRLALKMRLNFHDGAASANAHLALGGMLGHSDIFVARGSCTLLDHAHTPVPADALLALAGAPIIVTQLKMALPNAPLLFGPRAMIRATMSESSLLLSDAA
jgi:hypothetical protein